MDAPGPEHTLDPIPIPLATIRTAFDHLGKLVNRSLCTQVGDAARLGETKNECIRMFPLIEEVTLSIILKSIDGLNPHLIQHRAIIPTDEHEIIFSSLHDMISALDAACHNSVDPPDAP